MIVPFIVLAALMGLVDPDGVVATAPVGPGTIIAASPLATDGTSASPGIAVLQTPHGLTTSEQIDRWLATRDPEAPAYAESDAPAERRVQGTISAAIGTGDYSAYGATVTMPLGDSGFLSLSYSNSENAPWGHGYGYGYGYGYGLGGRELYPYGAGYGRFGHGRGAAIMLDGDRE